MRRSLLMSAVMMALSLGYWWARHGGTAPEEDGPEEIIQVVQQEQPRLAALPVTAEVGPPFPSSGPAALFHDPIMVAPCTLAPAGEQDVSSQVEGVLDEVLANLGQRVERGQLLGRLDDRQLRPQVELLQIKAASRSAELIARALHDEADSKVHYAVEANRSGLKAVPDLEYKTYLFQRERYAQEVKKAQEEQQTAAKELERARRVLELHEIRSGLAGEVVKVYKRHGESVRQAEPLFRVADFARLRVEGLVKAPQASMLRVGMRALVEPELRSEPMTRLSGHTGAVHGIAVAADGRLVASASEDRTVILWGWPQGGEQSQVQHPAEVYAVAFAPGTNNGRLLLTGCADAEGRLWSVSAAGKVEGPVRLKGHDGAIRAVAFSPDGGRCATAGEDKRVGVWEVANGKHLYWLQLAPEVQTAHHGAVTAVHFTADGRLLSAGRDNVLRLWQLGDGGARLAGTQPDRAGDAAQLGASADGRRGLFDHGEELRILDLRDWRCLGALQGRKQGHFQGLALFAPSGRLVLAGASNGRLQLWRVPADPAETAFFRQAYAHGFDRGSLGVFAAAPPFACGLAALGAGQGSPRLWRLDAAEVRHFLTPNATVTSGAFAPDESVIFTGGTDKVIRVWQVPPPRLWERPLEARLTFVGSEVERGTDMVRVRAEVDNPTDPALRLRPGTYASLRFYPETVE